jgi:hypothetical protein
MTVSNAYVDTVLEEFLRSGRLAQNLVRTPIAESWMRCYRDGVVADPTRGSSASRRRDPIRNHARDGDFVRAGLPILETKSGPSARAAPIRSELPCAQVRLSTFMGRNTIVRSREPGPAPALWCVTRLTQPLWAWSASQESTMLTIRISRRWRFLLPGAFRANYPRRR